MMKHVYETTYEREDSLGNVIASVEVRFTYTWRPGVPARIHYNEHDHPAEGDEIEIVKIECEESVKSWHEVDKGAWFDTLYDWGMDDLMDNMVEEAREAVAAREDER